MILSHRILPFALALFTLASLAGCASETDDDSDDGAPVEPTGVTANALAADITVYGDGALTKPWSNWGWSTDVSMGDTTSPRTSGSASQMKITMKNAWGALALARTAGDLPTATYDSLSFDIRANAGTKLWVSIQPLNGSSADVKLPIAVGTSWGHQTISFDNVRGHISSFGKINFQAEKAGETFYVDNVRLTAKGTSGTIPNSPITPSYEQVTTYWSSASAYHLYVPKSYDATHRTPTRLFVWLHGCGGDGKGDTWSVSPGGSQSWVSLSLGGRDGGCWNVDTDSSMVMAALADVKHRLNIDPQRVVIGGYSSGGDLAYRTAFYNALSFAGVLAENTSPFRDTDSSPSSSLTAASWKFNIAHLAHLQDTTYPIDGVRSETDQVRKAGFPIERLEKNGAHWNTDSNGTGTMNDRRTYLLPYLDRGWAAPQH